MRIDETIDWAGLGPLPSVTPFNKGRRAPTWQERRDAYAALPKEGLLVTAELATPVLTAEAGATHLDAALSQAALTDHPVRSGFQGQTVVIPLPLHLAWVSPDGRPLWASSPLVPATDAMETCEYWHKRYPSHRAELGDKQSANTSAGRYREYRMPVHAQVVHALHAVCIGNAAEVERLLQGVPFLGKKGSIGYGRVARWSVRPVDHALEDVLRARDIPLASGLDSGGPVLPPKGWTPPYWYAPAWLPCWGRR